MKNLTHTNPIQISNADKADYLNFAIDAAIQAGRATLPYFRSQVTVENKLSDGHFDPVTEADRKAERIVRELVGSTYPNHGILGEEFGLKEGNGLTWVIDPIDGTRSFISGLLHWGVLLALFDGETPVIGVLYQPFTEELFFGDGEVSNYRHNKQQHVLKVRHGRLVENAVLATTGPQFYESQAEKRGLARLDSAVRLSCFGGDCYLYAMLAMGQIDIAMDAGLSAYDIQALVPIVRGAGGVITTASGDNPSMGGFVVASTCEELHQRVLGLLN